MKKLFLLLAFLISPLLSHAQFNLNIGGLSFTSSGAVPSSCAVDGSKFFKNSATEGWYTCISGGFVADAAAGSAFTGGGGASFQDVGTIASPANPAANFIRLFASSSTGQLACLTSAGANCLAAAGVAGTNGQIQFNNTGSFGGFTMSGDCTIVTSTGVITCTKTGAVAFAASATTDTTNANNIASGTLAAARLPNPTATTLGGIESLVSVSHLFISSISTLGVPVATQPACADLSTALGGCSMSTTAGGDLSGALPSPTVAKINGNSVPSGAIADQALIGTAANTFGLTTLPNSTGGAAALTYVVSTHSYGTLSNILTGSLTSTRVPFANGTNGLTDSANLLYSAGSGFTQIQGANGTDAHYIKRFTDTSPTGNFLRFQDAAGGTDLFKVDVLGNMTTTSSTTGNASGNAGMISLIQGTAASAVTNAVNLQAPASVTTYTLTFPGTLTAGFWNQDGSGNISFGALSGDVTSAALVTTVAKVHGVTYPTTGASFPALPFLTSSNTVQYVQVNAGADCGDATHALKFTAATALFGCQTITAAAPGAGGATTQIQVNVGNALTGFAAFTTNSTDTVTIGLAGTTLGKLAMAGNTSGTTTINAAAAASGTLTLPAATDTLVGRATTDTLTNKTINATNNTISNITGAMMTSATVTATQLAAQYSKGSCTEVWGGTGAANVMASGDDAVTNNACYNDSGVTRTITAVKCRSDNAANTTVLTPTFGSAGTGTAILTGTLTCGNSYNYSATGTLNNTAWTTGTGIDAGMSTVGNATSIGMIVEYTY